MSRDNADFCHLGVLNYDPLVIMSCIDSFAPFHDNLAKSLSTTLQRPYTLLLQTWRSLEYMHDTESDFFPALAASIAATSQYDDASSIGILCNTEEESRICKAHGIDALFVNHNCFVNERLFKPLRRSKTFDAIYNAQPWIIKRHELAAEIRSLALIYSLHQGPAALQRLREIKRMAPSAFLVNGDATESPENFQYLSAERVNAAYNACSVGLCLSAVEGAMFSSVEYLLSGLKVLTTKNQGGRDVFFREPWCKWVGDTPGEVAQGVQDLKRLDVGADTIRRETLRLLTAHRVRLVNSIDELCAIRGGRNQLRGNFSRVTAHWAGLPHKSINELTAHLDAVSRLKKRRAWLTQLIPAGRPYAMARAAKYRMKQAAAAIAGRA